MNNNQSLLEAVLEARKRFKTESKKDKVEGKEEIPADFRPEREREEDNPKLPVVSQKSLTSHGLAAGCIRY